MSDHYYSSQPQVEHNRKKWEANLRGREYRFVSDAGVFSKQGVDYGSRVLIDALDIASSDQVLDVGCGYGPIGLAVASLAKEGHVTMIDINSRAVELAKENALANGIFNITAVQSDLYAGIGDQKFDAIVTNPPIRAGKQTVHAIFEGAYDRLVDGGALWIVIQKKQGAPSAKQKLESLFSVVDEVTKDKGYRIFKATK